MLLLTFDTSLIEKLRYFIADYGFLFCVVIISFFSDLVWLLVLIPNAGLPQGVTGFGRPIGDLPSPPPCG